MNSSSGLHFISSTTQVELTSLEEINSALSEIGAAVRPIDLKAAPNDLMKIVGQESLTVDENQEVLEYFLLSRERLLEVIDEAGRDPNVSGGGLLKTYVSNHDYWYPQLWVAQAGEDYSRFDRLHVNAADDGTGVDEVLQMVAGAGVTIVLQLENKSELTLDLACPDSESGWMITYNGGRPHIGSVSSAMPGTKLVTQVIGPESWQMRYV